MGPGFFVVFTENKAKDDLQRHAADVVCNIYTLMSLVEAQLPFPEEHES